MEDYIMNVIAPKLQGDGGWIEVCSYEEGELKVILKGECSKCNIALRCMNWIKAEVKRDLGKDITITTLIMKPFFWDKEL